MSDTVKRVREGGARLEIAREGRPAHGRFVRVALFVAGLLAMIARTAAAIAVEHPAWSPLSPRAFGIVTLVLEALDDPARALVPLALATTVSGAVAAWRRGAAVAAFVGCALVSVFCPPWA